MGVKPGSLGAWGHRKLWSNQWLACESAAIAATAWWKFIMQIKILVLILLHHHLQQLKHHFACRQLKQ